MSVVIDDVVISVVKQPVPTVVVNNVAILVVKQTDTSVVLQTNTAVQLVEIATSSIVVQTNTVIQTVSIGAVGPQGIPGPQGPSGTPKYKVGTSISDADFSQTPVDGTMATTYDPATTKTLMWTRANAVWRAVEAT